MGATMKRVRLGAVAVAAVVGTVVVTSTATATTTKPGHTTAQQCTENVRTGQRKCFNTFAEAMNFAAQGRSATPPPVTKSSPKSDSLQADGSGTPANSGLPQATTSSQAATDVIIGTIFSSSRYGGATLTLWGPHPCEDGNGADFSFNLPDNWKNRITSVQPWGNCWIKLDSAPNLSGLLLGTYKENTIYVGDSANNLAQSLEFD